MTQKQRIAKAQPTLSAVHVNKPLTNISVAYIQRAGFVADVAFPQVPVENKSDLYYKFDQGDFWRDEAAPRAPGTESAGGGFGLSTDSYNCSVIAYHKDLDDQIMGNADAVLQLDTAATEFVTQKLLINRERTWASTFFTTSVWGTDITGVASSPSTGQVLQWSVSATSTPLADVEAGKVQIASQTGFVPNTLIMGYQVFSALRNNAAIKDQFKYTSSQSIDQDMMARYFGVDRILVMSAAYSTSKEGQTETFDFIGSKSALLCYSAPAPSLLSPTAGYTFTWTGFQGASGGVRIKRFRVERLESMRVEGQMAYAQKVVAPAMGYFFTSIVA